MTVARDVTRITRDPATEIRLDALVALTQLLDLESVDITVRAAKVFGKGAGAPVQVYLSNGEMLEFAALRDMAKATLLAAEVAACSGAVPKLKPADAMRAIALVRTVAERQETFSENDIAREWGETFLAATTVLDVDFSDQAERFAAFEHLSRRAPEQEPHKAAEKSLVLRDQCGDRYVRCGWFYLHVRGHDLALSQAALAGRMARVGWKRRGRSGRIKATAVHREATLGWNFWTVPDGWEEDR